MLAVSLDRIAPDQVNSRLGFDRFRRDLPRAELDRRLLVSGINLLSVRFKRSNRAGKPPVRTQCADGGQRIEAARTLFQLPRKFHHLAAGRLLLLLRARIEHDLRGAHRSGRVAETESPAVGVVEVARLLIGDLQIRLRQHHLVEERIGGRLFLNPRIAADPVEKLVETLLLAHHFDRNRLDGLFGQCGVFLPEHRPGSFRRREISGLFLCLRKQSLVDHPLEQTGRGTGSRGPTPLLPVRLRGQRIADKLLTGHFAATILRHHRRELPPDRISIEIFRNFHRGLRNRFRRSFR